MDIKVLLKRVLFIVIVWAILNLVGIYLVNQSVNCYKTSQESIDQTTCDRLNFAGTFLSSMTVTPLDILSDFGDIADNFHRALIYLMCLVEIVAPIIVSTLIFRDKSN